MTPALRNLALVIAFGVSGASCQGCPSEPGTFVPVELGSLNPLFDRVEFEDFAGRVVDPSVRVPKRVRIELVLPVAPSSIHESHFAAFSAPPSLVIAGNALAAPGAPGELRPVRIDRVRFVRAGVDVVAVRVILDRRAVERERGRDLLVQVDPRAWAFRTPVSTMCSA